MLKTMCLAIFILISPFSYAKGEALNVQLVYSGFDFLIPSGQDAIGASGGDSDFLVFRYGKNKGQDYLAFTDMSNDDSSSYGCAPAEFFSDLFESNEVSECNKNELASFKKAFLDNSESGSWKGPVAISYYSIGESRSFVFLIYKNKIVKIDTDFLTKSELKNILSKIVK